MTTIQITLLTAEGCHYCARARQILERLRQEWPLAIEEVPMHSPEGANTATRDGIAFPPGVYLNGVLFGYGRLSEGRLRRRLRELTRP